MAPFRGSPARIPTYNGPVIFARVVGAAVCLLGAAAFGQQYTISTFAGGALLATGQAGLHVPLVRPQGVATDLSGNVFFASNNCILRLDQGGVLTRVAGTGRPGYGGDGGPAVNAQLSGPVGVAVDTTGTVYIGDTGNHRVRKVSPAGVISTIAGTGVPGFFGDGRSATAAEVASPSGLALDVAGNLYLADAGNGRVRKITAAGIISTVAGNGGFGFSGDGGPAVNAAMSLPRGVAVDGSGNIYITDENERVREVSGGIISTVAGNGTYGYSGDGGAATKAALAAPNAVAIDKAGNLLIADGNNNRVRKVDSGGTITTVAAGSGIVSPSGLAVDASGNLYVADQTANIILKVSPDGSIETVAGTGTASSGDGQPATQAQLSSPSGVAFDSSGNVFIADSTSNTVRMVSPDGIIKTVAGNPLPGGTGDGGPAVGAFLFLPLGIAVDGKGNLYIAESGTSRIRMVTPAGTISTVAGNGTAGYAGDGGPAPLAKLNAPFGVAVDKSGNLYIADYDNYRIRKVTPDGIISTVAGNGIAGYAGDGGRAVDAEINVPTGVAVDNAGNIYIADAINERIRRVTPGGIISTVAGNGGAIYSGDGSLAVNASMFYPSSVSVDGAANLYIVDTGGRRIRMVTPSGTIQTVGGNGISGYTGDGGPATSAEFTALTSVAATDSGAVFAADAASNAVRLLQAAPSITAGGVVAADSSSNTIASGEWISIFGSNLAPLAGSWNGSFGTSLEGTTVKVDGRPAYVSYAGPNQINVQVPDDTTLGTVQVVVTTAGGRATSSATLAQKAPSFLLLDGKHVAGIILRFDGSGNFGGGTYDIIGPTGTALGYPSTPARAGDVIELFALGLGATNPAVHAGQAYTGAAPTAEPVTVLLNGLSVTPTFAGLSGAGLYQINLVIPPGAGSGDVALKALVGGAQTQAGVVVSLQ